MRKLWIEVRSSLWFVPGLLVLTAIGLALGLVEVDLTFAQQLQAQRWQPLLNTGAEGARGMLTAIAGSMITVAGVVFSMTIVTLSLASTQYTPRILRNFMRDRANQIVLGIFVAIFAYCLIVLRTIRGGAEKDGAGFVPLLAVAFAMLLALLSIGCLIFFIHHVATSIQASSILSAIAQQTMRAIETLFPKELGRRRGGRGALTVKRPLAPGSREGNRLPSTHQRGWAAAFCRRARCDSPSRSPARRLYCDRHASPFVRLRA